MRAGCARVQEAREGTETWCVPRLLATLLTIHANDGRRAAALEVGQEAQAAFTASGETLGLAGVLSSLSWVLSERDDDTESVRRSVELAEQAVAALDPQRHPYQTASTLHDLVGARIAAKDWQGARRDAAVAERLLRGLDLSAPLAYIRRLQGEIELRDGKPTLALRYLQEAHRVFAEARVDQMVVAIATLEAEALLDLHRPEQAQRMLADVAPLRERLGLPKTDVPYFRATMEARAAVQDAAGTAAAARAYADALQRRLRLRLKRLAEVDELTALPNRRAIAMLDIDHFKRVNDRYGHAAGDAALVTFAQACGGVLREGDVMGRLGGEEFLLVLHRARAAELQPLFERMRGVLRASPVPGMPPEERLSFSMGAVDLPAGADVEAALRMADEALYRAKAGGRDRMEIGAPSGGDPLQPAAGEAIVPAL